MPHDDFTFEPIPGLPSELPAGEEVLWQGRPSTWALAREALNLNWVLGYFAVLTVWRIGASATTMPMAEALATGLPFVVLAALSAVILLGIALVQARATVYTITTARVAMRIGAALTVTFNLPFQQIASADLDLRRRGTGTVALTLKEGSRLSYLVLWPHVRPWRTNPARPALRCIPEAERVAAILADAAETRVNAPVVAPAPAASAVAAE